MNEKSFVKVYGEGLDQVAILRQENEFDEPEVRVFFQGLDIGVSSIAFTYEASTDGADAADDMFDGFSQNTADKILAFLTEKGVR